jgi:hypothetical protein
LKKRNKKLLTVLPGGGLGVVGLEGRKGRKGRI